MPSNIVTLREIVSDLFMCLGPLRICEEPVQEYIVDPVTNCVLEPVTEKCVDPLKRELEVNPLAGCIPCLTPVPTLPQSDSSREQQQRADELGARRSQYQYDYSLVRTFKVVERDGQKVGIQGRGIAILASLPAAQLPSLCWVALVLQHALVLLDNLILVLDLIADEPRRLRTVQNEALSLEVEGEQRADAEQATVEIKAKAVDHAEPTLTAVLQDVAHPDDIAATRAEAQNLRNSLFTTFLFTQRLNSLAAASNDPDAPQSLVTLPPPHETDDGICPCPRCSPQNFTRELSNDLMEFLSGVVEKLLLLKAFDRRPFSIRAYNELFQAVPLPEFALTFQNDEMFALQRIAGQNPVVIHGVDFPKWQKLAHKFPVTDEQYQKTMGKDDTLEEAAKDGRLYVCDYEESLANTIAGDFPPFAGQKYLYAPLLLLALEKADRNIIRAVAIQTQQDPRPDNPIITPDCGWNWEIAKTIVQNSDCNDSEYYRHLGLGHLLTEAFILATYRQLSERHPLYVLLVPNFKGTLFTNQMAVTSINQEGSYLNITEQIFSPTVPSLLGIAANSVARVSFNANMLPKTIERAGTADPKLMPNYPYRDDAMLIWNAIRNWARGYIGLYYTSDRDVTADYELQNWARELSSWEGGRIRDVGDGPNNSILTIDYLIDAMAEVIYTASAHHALCNFPLEDYEIYHPGWPGSIFQPAPTEAVNPRANRHTWMQYFAPLNIAMLQQALGYTVGGVYFTQLGEYGVCYFNDSRVRGPLSAFQTELASAENVIRERNLSRALRYTYLLPSRIPASTNI